MTSDDFTGSWQMIYTPMFPMHEYRRLIVQMVVNSFEGPAGAVLSVYPITTVTGHPGQFVELVSCAFTPLVAGCEPSMQAVEVSPNGTMSGLELAFQDVSGSGQPMVADLTITGLAVS